MAKIPARYRGEATLRLGSYGGPYFDGDGNPRISLLIHTGDVLLMEEHEIRGDTHLVDPHGERPTEFLGTGRVVKPEHAGRSNEELSVLGYVFCTGRSDFQEVVSSDAPQYPGEPVTEQVSHNTMPAPSRVEIGAFAPVDVQEQEESVPEAS